MISQRVLLVLVGVLVAAAPARAVYAPIPESEQGDDLAFTFAGGLSHDSNIFGAATGAIASTIYEVSPKVAYNRSVTDQTFMSLSYQLTLDQFENRPGQKTLDSHTALARVAHAFSPATTLDVVDNYMLSRNPESLLNGIPLNVDQSLQRNELDGHFDTAIAPKIGAAFKARSVYYDYRNSSLGRDLNRLENLYGIAADFGVLPDVKAVGEYRHQDVFYEKQGELKNKTDDFLMTGVDYSVAKKFTTSARLGVDWRQRASQRNTTAPSVELSGKYDYADGSFVTFGYTYDLEETSDITRFTDSKVNRVFANVQHSLTPLFVASGSVTYEPSVLQGRSGFATITEDTLRAGAALSYLPTQNWTFSVSYDDDHINSEDVTRNLRRERFGLNASYHFGKKL